MATAEQEFITGERAPISGVYGFVRPTGSEPCTPTDEEREIPLSRGEAFPPIRSCAEGAVWRLVRKA
jgi:hypothetical protein